VIQLSSIANEKLSEGIRNLSPELYDTITIENKLIDGTTHIQIIGEPAKYLTFEVLANHNQTSDINEAQSTGEKLKLTVYDVYYIGFISKPAWERFSSRNPNPTKRFYVSEVRIDVTEEGST
jgi:hypothetical protein